MMISRRLLLVTAAVLVCAGCQGHEDATAPAPTNVTQDFIGGVFATGSLGPGVSQTAQAPASTGGPSVTMTGSAAVSADGGGIVLQVNASAPFLRLIVSVNGKTGFYDSTFLSSRTDALVQMFINKVPGFTLQIQAVTAGGTIGPPASLSVNPSGAAKAVLFLSIDQDPVPFVGNQPCQAGGTSGCIYRWPMSVSEVGGVSVTVTEFQVTLTFGGPAAPRVITNATLPNNVTQIAANGPVISSTFGTQCGTPTCDADFFAAAPGSMFYSVTGKDANGNTVTARSNTVVLGAHN